jgi:hypothetical protein
MPKKITNTKLSNVVNIKIGDTSKPKRRRGKKGAGKKKAVLNTRDLLTAGGLTSTPGINANTGQVGYQLADYIPPLFDQRKEIADTPRQGDVDVNTVNTKSQRPPVKAYPGGSSYAGRAFDKEIETLPTPPNQFSNNKFSNYLAGRSLAETPNPFQPMRGGGGEPYPSSSPFDLPVPAIASFAPGRYEYPEAVAQIVERYNPGSARPQDSFSSFVDTMRNAPEMMRTKLDKR